MKNLKTNQKGITLIALIITIIVMLILVGVTISVALNGGLFGKGEKAAFQTEVSTIKEQLELEKASRVMENDGKRLEDYSGIKVADLAGIDEKTKTEFGNKIIVNKAGDICYNPETVTDAEEIEWLKEIGINPNEGEIVKSYAVAYESQPAWGSNGLSIIYMLDNGIWFEHRDGEFYDAGRYIKNGNEINFGNVGYILSEDNKTMELTSGSTPYQLYTKNENDRYEYNPVQHPTYKVYTNAFYEYENDTIIATSDTEVLGEGTFEELLAYGATVSNDGKTITSPEGDIFTLVE